MGLRILAGKMLKQQMTELEVEQSLAKVLTTVPLPPDWVKSEKNYAIQVCMILLQKFEGKIETLILKILELTLATYHNEVEDKYAVIILNFCVTLVPNINLDAKVHQITFKLIEKVVVFLSKDRLLVVSPMVLGRLIKAITGDYSRKDVYLKSAIKSFETFIQRWSTQCYDENREIESFRIESNKIKAQQELLMIGSQVSTKSLKIPTLNQKFKTSKEIQDFLFETFYSLSPLHSSKSFLPSLSESVLKEYAKRIQEIANYLRQFPVVMIPLTSLCIFLIPYADIDYAYDLVPSTEDFRSLMAFSKEVETKKCLAKLKVLCILSQNDDPKVKSLFTALNFQEILRLIPFNAQVLEIISEIGTSSEDSFPDSMPITEKIFGEINFKMFHEVINFIKDYFPSLHFSKEIIGEFFIFLGKAASRETTLQLISHLEDFVAFSDSLPVQSQTSHSKPQQKITISIFENSVRQYSAVNEPLDDLASVFLLLIGILTSSQLSRADLDRLMIAAINTKRSVETYIDCAVMTGSLKKLYKTIIVSQILLLLTKTQSSLLIQGFEPSLADLQTFVSAMLTIEGTSQMHLSLAKQAIRVVAYQISPYSSYFGWKDPLSADDLIANLSFNIVEKVKLTLLNFPNSSTVVSTLHLMAGLSQYNHSKLADTLLPVLHSFFVKNNRPHHILPLLLVFQRLLLIMNQNREELIKESKNQIDQGQKSTTANVVRQIGLQAFLVLPATSNTLAVEILWQCAGSLLEAFLDVPMALEDHSSSFSANEPAHCIIDNSGGAFVVEIWPIIVKEIQSLSGSYLLADDSIGGLVLEMIQSRTDRKRENLKTSLLQKIKEDCNITIQLEESQILMEAAMFFGRECSLVVGKPQAPKHSNLLLLPCLAFIAKIRRLNPSILSVDRLVQILDYLALVLLTAPLQTVSQAKLVLEISRLWRLSDRSVKYDHYERILKFKLQVARKLDDQSSATPIIVKKYLAQFISEHVDK